MRFVIVALVLALGGCMSDRERAERQSYADDATCRSYGFTLGTDSYAQCRMAVAQQRQANAAMIAGVLLGRPAAPAAAPRLPVYQMPVNRPVITNCQPMGLGTTCTSN